ncbi:putative recombinase XerD [Brevibacillus phage SecTim467]|uniref:Integrase n=2 Tax=Jenstvirus jenst TaxID=1982225 RepID=A0A0K2CP59_9CAUD|nr:integrase [Brevibacillus phage Jenst]ALA07183.1 putative recombinase XerD [Brevibacillus phage Jenst]ALA07551.1 putative recombinase XerD [Brevibacillus phage SecTim467]
MNYVESFKLYLQTDKNSSKHTIDSYERDIINFLDFEKTPKDVTEITPSHIRMYIAHLDVLGRARSSINRMLCSLKTFFKYLVDIEHAVKDSPAAQVKCGKKEKPLPKAISKTDVNSLITTATEHRLKDQLIIELLYGLGGRVSEIAKIRVEDINFEEGFIRMKGKGKKTRENPIHAGCLELIKLFMFKHKITSGWLLPSKLDPSAPMSREGIYKVVKRVASISGIDPRAVSPHVFRHSYATHLLDNGCDMAIVQEYLGHEDIATTKIYAQISKKNKKETFAKYHPLANTI